MLDGVSFSKEWRQALAKVNREISEVARAVEGCNTSPAAVTASAKLFEEVFTRDPSPNLT
jgi:hypothetical protein